MLRQSQSGPEATRAILLGACAGLALLAAIPAHAQTAGNDQTAQPQSEATPQQSAEEKEFEEIVVTGSRIPRPNLTAPNPVTIVDSEQILASGETDISTLLREIPALHQSLPANQSDQNGAPSGVGLLNLRGLGTERTLVLVNGRRHVAGVSGTAAVDIATIPVDLIERVDVQTGSASAVYGADGVSGVVNFILKDDFEGLTYRGQAGITDNGDGEEWFLSAVGGFNFDDGRGNAVVSVEYTHNERINVADRKFAGSGLASFMPNSPELAAFLGVNPDAANTFAPNRTLPVSSKFGIIWLQDADAFFDPGFINLLFPNPTVGGFPVAQIIDENGNLRPFNPGDIFVNLFNAIGGDAIPVSPDVGWLQPDINRIVVNGNFHYQITDGIRFFTESKFAYTNTHSLDQVNGFNDDIPIALDNPFIPAALRAQINALLDMGITPRITVSRDNLDVPSEGRTDRYTFRIVSGFDGDFDNGWHYEISFNYGQTQSNITNLKARVEDRFFAAIDAVVDPDTGEIVCRSDLDPTAVPPVAPFPDVRQGFLTFSPGDGQCKPLNIFGFGNFSQEAIDFIFVRATDTIKIKQQVISAVLSGDSTEYFTLPGGPVGFAAGFEYREEQSNFDPSDFEKGGLLFNTVTTRSEPVRGRFDVWELFGEVRLPILADKPFVEELEIDGAVRFSDYSTVGSTLTWNFGGAWRPIEDIRLRSTYGRAIRAPNINELFSPPQPIFISADFDPCNPSLINAGTEFRKKNCLELVGPDFDSTKFVSAFITGRAGGNPNLKEETADTLTVGAVITPRFLPGFTATVDFYDVRIKDAIIVVDPERIIENCVDAPTLDNVFCDLVDRDPTFGFITFFRSGEQNVAKLTAQGIDFGARYLLELADLGFEGWGSLTFGVTGTHLLKRNDFEFQDFPDEKDVVKGEFAFPDWVVNLDITWERGRWTVAWQTRFESSQLLPGVEVEDLISDPLFVDPTHTGNSFVHDLSVRYQVRQNLQVYGGVNNLAGRKPYLASLTRPAGFVGTFFFLGVTGNF